MFTTEDILNVLEDYGTKPWKFHSEQFKLEKLLLEGHLLLMYLNSLLHFCAPENCFSPIPK